MNPSELLSNCRAPVLFREEHPWPKTIQMVAWDSVNSFVRCSHLYKVLPSLSIQTSPFCLCLIMDDLELLDPAYVADTLSRPPFVTINGVLNARDLGLYPSVSHPDKITKPRFLYRSAELSNITPEGKIQIKEMGISKVFDLRSNSTIEKTCTPPPDINGVEIIQVAVFDKEKDSNPETMAKRYKLYTSGKTEAFLELYSEILDNGGPSLGVILRHIRDKPNEGCLIHCTMGKNRTGITTAILLKLVGVDDDAVVNDFALTQVGCEPARAAIIASLPKVTPLTPDSKAALNKLTCRRETMTALLSLLQDKYGGAEEYVRCFVGLSDEDIATIRSNILIPRNSRL